MWKQGTSFAKLMALTAGNPMAAQGDEEALVQDANPPQRADRSPPSPPVNAGAMRRKHERKAGRSSKRNAANARIQESETTGQE